MKLYTNNNEVNVKMIVTNRYTESDAYYFIKDGIIDNKIVGIDISYWITKGWVETPLTNIYEINNLLNNIIKYDLDILSLNIDLKDSIKTPEVDLSKLETLIRCLDNKDINQNHPICFDFLNDADLDDTHTKAIRVQEILNTIGYKTGLVICNQIYQSDKSDVINLFKESEVVIFINHEYSSLSVNYIWDMILDTTNITKKIVCNFPVDNFIKNRMVII